MNRWGFLSTSQKQVVNQLEPLGRISDDARYHPELNRPWGNAASTSQDDSRTPSSSA